MLEYYKYLLLIVRVKGINIINKIRKQKVVKHRIIARIQPNITNGNMHYFTPSIYKKTKTINPKLIYIYKYIYIIKIYKMYLTKLSVNTIIKISKTNYIKRYMNKLY